jgi:hypothetical protein
MLCVYSLCARRSMQPFKALWRATPSTNEVRFAVVSPPSAWKLRPFHLYNEAAAALQQTPPKTAAPTI